MISEALLSGTKNIFVSTDDGLLGGNLLPRINITVELVTEYVIFYLFFWAAI